MSDDDFVPDYYDYSDRDDETQPEFTVILDENPCDTLVVGEGDDREVFVVIDDIHKKRPSEEATKGSAIKGKRKVRSVVLPTEKPKSLTFGNPGFDVIWCAAASAKNVQVI